MNARKKVVLDLVRGMPNEIDFDDLIDRLYLLFKIEKAEADVAAGDVLSDAEVGRLIDEWQK